MHTLLTEFKDSVLDQLLELIWRQWTSLGVSGYVKSEELKVVDPEALLLLTLTVARYDARLFDEVLEWLQVNGSFLNAQKLQNLLKQYEFQAGPQLSAVAEILGSKSTSTLKWKKLASQNRQETATPLFIMKNGTPFKAPINPDQIFKSHGLLRPAYQPKGVSQYFPSTGDPTLLLRLRALMGVNIRGEILCIMGSLNEIHPALIARLIGQDPRTTQKLLANMIHSGIIGVRTRSREKLYSLNPNMMDSLLRPCGPTPWRNSVPLFRALEILWLGISDPKLMELDSLTLASQFLRIARQMDPLLGDAGMNHFLQTDLATHGEIYFEVFSKGVANTLNDCHPSS